MSEVYLGRGGNRRVLTLGALLGEGAAGTVHSLPGMRGSAAKIYHAGTAGKHEQKIDAMLASPPELPPALHEGVRYPQIAWPQDKLFDRSGRFIGFVMPEIDFGRSTSLVNLLQKNSRRVERLSEYYGYRVLVARNLASVFAELHKAGHHMIDMKPANLRFYPAVSWMAVVDTDGFSILGKNGRIAADQVSDEYIAPESWKREPSALGLDQDLFALAVIIFQLLNNGVHPFSGASGKAGHATDLQSRILQGLYPYAFAPIAGPEPSTASLHRMFRRGTREMFDCAFLPGGRRPNADAWRDHLDTLMNQMVPCAAKPEEHVHFGSGCGFCAHEARIAAARASAARRPRHDITPRRAPVRTGAARVHASGTMLVPTRPRQQFVMAPTPPQGYRPPARRATPNTPRRWGSIVAMAAAGVALFASQGLWLPLIPENANARAADVTALTRPAIVQADIADFPEPRDFRIVPAGGELTVPLRVGPGASFATVDRLNLHEAVVGTGAGVGENGQPWVRVRRNSDGAEGFVQEAALMVQGEPDAALSLAAIGRAEIEREIELRYRALENIAQGHDREWLREAQRLWKAQRDRCTSGPMPEACRDSLNRQRQNELENWTESDLPEVDSAATGPVLSPAAYEGFN